MDEISQEELNKELANRFETAKKISFLYRGQIIDAVASFERHLDSYIATYFCDDFSKVVQFANIILGGNRISLDGKRKIFDILIKIENPDFHKINTEFSKDMNTIMYERNSFAHNVLGLDNEDFFNYQPDHISLQKFGVNTRLDRYDEKRITDILNTITKCADIIRKIASPREIILYTSSKQNKTT